MGKVNGKVNGMEWNCRDGLGWDGKGTSKQDGLILQNNQKRCSCQSVIVDVNIDESEHICLQRSKQNFEKKMVKITYILERKRICFY